MTTLTSAYVAIRDKPDSDAKRALEAASELDNIRVVSMPSGHRRKALTV